MQVELLFFDGCPNHDALVPALRGLLEREGVDADLRMRRIPSAEAAEAERFLGSPSLRIDGVDVDPGAASRDDFGLKCRLYHTPDGLRGVPPDAWILAALGRARSAAGGT